MKTLSIFLEASFLAVLLLIFFTVGLFLGDGTIDGYFVKEISSPGSICNDENNTLVQTANCLEKELEEFYDYNISNLWERDLTIEELKTQGGVCYHYANWYCGRAESLGFYCKTASMDITEEVGHRIAIISDETGYCILDQTFMPQCYGLQQVVFNSTEYGKN